MREEKLFRVARRFIGRRRGFWEVFVGFSEFFRNFLQFFWNFLQFFGKFSQKFSQFFRLLRFPYDFSENFSENSRPQSVTVQPGSRHYCKFTSKFTPKFTPILIKILQSTKFEGSHFFNSFQLFTTINRLSKPYVHFPNLFPSLCSFPFATVFSRP